MGFVQGVITPASSCKGRRPCSLTKNDVLCVVPCAMLPAYVWCVVPCALLLGTRDCYPTIWSFFVVLLLITRLEK